MIFCIQLKRIRFTESTKAKFRSLNKFPEHLVQLITRRSTGSGRRKDSWRRAKRNGLEQDMTTSRLYIVYTYIYIDEGDASAIYRLTAQRSRAIKLCNASSFKTEYRIDHGFPGIHILILIRTFVGRRLHNYILFIAVSSNVEIKYFPRSRSRMCTKTTTDEWTLPNLFLEN